VPRATLCAAVTSDVAGANGRKEALMSAQTGYLQPDAIGVFPTVLLLLVIILAMLGVVAHAAFI
jgi:hypothetical protein